MGEFLSPTSEVPSIAWSFSTQTGESHANARLS